MQTVIPVLKDIVGAAAYNNTRFFIGQLADDIMLCYVKLIIERQRGERGAAIHAHIIKEPRPGRGLLSVLTNERRIKAALFGYLCDELAVIKLYAEFLCDKLAYRMACASELTAYGDYPDRHIDISFSDPAAGLSLTI